MIFRLTGYIKRRIIDELRNYWKYHPRYPDLADNIQGKFSFEGRPLTGMIVKTGSGNRMDLSADNYIGILESYVYLTKVKNYPGVAIEWVRENSVAIQNNGGVFPSLPGVYFINLTEDEEFYVEPLYDVYNEQVMMPTDTRGVLLNPPLAGTVRLYEMPASYQLYEGTNYNLVQDPSGAPTGEIEFLQPITNGRWIVADYRYAGEVTGPHVLVPENANHRAIPGVVLAFGNWNQKGDRMAVVVQEKRSPAALEYGGKWDLSVDIDVLALDNDTQQEIADRTVLYLYGILRSRLSSEGLEITDVSMGGESEEIYDDTGDDYYYNSSISMTISTDWVLHVPLNVLLRTASPLTVEQAKAFSVLSEDDIAKQKNNLQILETLGLDANVDPFYGGSTYEIIR